MTNANKPVPRCRPLPEWPELDLAQWRRALCPDPLDLNAGTGRKWRPTTRRMVSSGYGRWLNWLAARGDLDESQMPGARVTRDRVSAFYQSLVSDGLADYSRSAVLQNLANALRVMEPTGDWRWIATGASRIHEHAVPRRPVDVTSRSPNDLIDLGHALMEAGDKALAIDFLKRFVLYRDGLLIAFLAQRPLRIGEAAAICVGRQLQKRGEAWHLSFEGEEMKNGRPFELSWPSTLTSVLERYLEFYRAGVVTNAGDQRHEGGLWLSQFGTRTAPSCLGHRVERRTREAFGKHINPHLLRKLAASLIADYAPNNITDAARLLGHADLRVTEKHYIKANRVLAVQRHQEIVRQHR